jgi:lipopolysaccharide/colanic/teichoic acid biosynthesis glycosyltransferase
MLRILDVFFSLLGLIFLTPFFLFLALWIKLDSNGPVFYIQKRVGKNNIDFDLYKFRSMNLNADKFGLLTVGGRDSRITNSGYFLRKYKLDELPQLFNVLIGDMSLVGPRPEVRKYVEFYSKEQMIVLSVRPGITDISSLTYKNENELLGNSENPEKTYLEEVMPRKIELSMAFIKNPTISVYFQIILKTIFNI